MAKKAGPGFNMAAAVRAILAENPALSGREVYDALRKKHPKQKINEGSCGVAFSAARKTLGIASRKRKRRRTGKKTTVRKRLPSAKPALDLVALQTAAKFIALVGDADAAIDVIRQVKSLQIS